MPSSFSRLGGIGAKLPPWKVEENRERRTVMAEQDGQTPLLGAMRIEVAAPQPRQSAPIGPSLRHLVDQRWKKVSRYSMRMRHAHAVRKLGRTVAGSRLPWARCRQNVDGQ